MTSSRGGTRPWVPFQPLIMYIHGVTFTVTNKIIYFIFYLIKITQIIHIINITLSPYQVLLLSLRVGNRHRLGRRNPPAPPIGPTSANPTPTDDPKIFA
jgi:hypothetical protein